MPISTSDKLLDGDGLSRLSHDIKEYINSHSGSSDYSQLSNKPSINGVTLSGDKKSVDLDLVSNDTGQDLKLFVHDGKLCASYGMPDLVPFSTATDVQIKDILDAYYADKITLEDIQNVWHVGDTRTIHLNAMDAPSGSSISTWEAQDITVVIVAFNHNDLATPINGHTKACITVQTREVLNNNSQSASSDGHIYINGSDDLTTDFKKWSQLYIRSYMNDKVLGAFSNGFRECIKPSVHYRHTDYNTDEAEQVTDILFLPSRAEIYGTEQFQIQSTYTPTVPPEGTQFPYYETANNRLKYGNNNGAPNSQLQYWWTGSPYDQIIAEWTAWLQVFLGSGSVVRGPQGVTGNNRSALAPAWVM